MNKSLSLLVVAVITAPLCAQKDTIVLTSGEVIDNAKVSGFTSKEIKFKVRGSMRTVSTDKLVVTKLWHRKGKSETDTDSIHSIISTPYINNGYIYGVDSYGEFRCLDLNTGDRVWESLDLMPKARWATAHLIPNGDKVWLFTEKGELIISELSPKGFKEISRAKLIEPTMGQLPRRGGVCWTHPAFADKHVFVRNDNELVCASLVAKLLGLKRTTLVEKIRTKGLRRPGDPSDA